MPLPPCVMRESRLAPDGKTYDFCRHPDFPHQLRLLAHYPDICQACPLRQAEGTRPPLVDPEAYTPGKLRPDLTAIERTLPPPDEKNGPSRGQYLRVMVQSPIPSGMATGSRLKSPAATSATLTTLGTSCPCGGLADSGWHKALSKSPAGASGLPCAATSPRLLSSASSWAT